MINSKKPLFFILVFFTLHFISGYPGNMSPDTFHQFHQSLNWEFDNHHPPLMALLWAILNDLIYPGPQTMLFLHLSMLWASIYILFNSDPNNKYRWLYLFIPFIPNILTQSTTIWKDIGFAYAFLLAISGCTYFTFQNKKAPIIVFVALLLVTFYGMSIKFQSKFIVPIIIFWIVNISISSKLYLRILLTCLISVLIIFGNDLVTEKNAKNTNTWQLRYVFVVSGIAVKINDDSILPQYIRESELYNFDKLKKHYTSKWVDTLIFHKEGKIFKLTSDSNNLDSLNHAFNNAIFKYPLVHISNRAQTFKHILNEMEYTYPIISESDATKHSIHRFSENYLNKFFAKAIRLYPKKLRTNWVSFFLVLLYSFVLTKYKSQNNNTALGYIALICIGYSITLFFVTLASEYRYFFLVRLLSFFSIPMILNLISTSRK